MDVRPACGFMRLDPKTAKHTVRCVNPAIAMVEWTTGVLVPGCAECAGAATTLGNWGTQRPRRR